MHRAWHFAILRGVSSAGRAPPLQGGGRGFEPPTLHRILSPRHPVRWRGVVLHRRHQEKPMSTVATRPPAVGEKAPDFTLPSTSGEDVTLRDFRGERAVLLAFFPLA